MTAIFDAIVAACKLLAPVSAAHPTADLRVLVLSDGQNNTGAPPTAALAALAGVGAVCDCMIMGDGSSRNADDGLRRLVAASEGRCVAVASLSDAFEVWQRRTSLPCRKAAPWVGKATSADRLNVVHFS